MIRKWNITDEKIMQKCVSEVIARIEEIGSAKAGIIAAQDIIDIVTMNCGPELYNKGIRDTKKLLQDRFRDLEVDIDVLEQHP